MKAYRSRYGELEGATLLVASTDDLETQRKFKAELDAPFPFIADPEGELAELYDVKTPLLTYAKRRTFVIGPDRTIRHIDEGGDAIDPEAAIRATMKLVERAK